MRHTLWMYLGIAVIVVALLAPSALAQKATVGVSQFKNAAGIDRRVSSALVDMITTQLAKSRKFNVVERERLGDVANEQLLGSSGAVSSDTAARTGRVTGADYLVMGTVTECGISSRNIAVGGVRTSKGSLTLAIDIRFVDSETSSIKFAETFRASRSSFSWGGRGAYFDVRNGDTGALAREVINKITRKVLGSIYPPKIVRATDPNDITLNYGGTMFNVGEVWGVFSQGEDLVDPDTGEVLGSDEELIAEIRITSVQDRLSKAETISGTPANGAVCRYISSAPTRSNRKKKVDPF